MSQIKVLVIAGGGGGGGSIGGGGGGGGYQYDAAFVVTAQAYSVTVGDGGASATVGSDSVFDTITANGGGKGGAYNSGSPVVPAGNGGSGGGGGGDDDTSAAGGTGSQGQNGGAGRESNNSDPYAAGGGGGATAVGGSAAGQTKGGDGGAGTANSISGSSVTYAGGGGGGASGTGNTGAGAGGSGGGGAGSNSGNGTAGTANLGGGGGGGTFGAGGGIGGKGVVIVSYITTDFGSCTGGDITTDGGNTVHTFTSSGTFTVVALTTTTSTSSSTTRSTSTTTTLAPPSDTSYLFDGSTVSDHIEILMPDGFQVGNNVRVNTNNIDYYYFAFKKNTQFFDIGSYTGNGITATNIGTIFTPTLAWIQKTSGTDAKPVWGTADSMTTDSTLRFGNDAILTNAILGLSSIELGVNDTVNTASASYSYLIWKNPEQVTVVKKYFQYKVYSSGSYLTTWTPYEILTEPAFRNMINGGPGEVTVRLARDFDSFGEDVDVKLNNRVDIWVYDREAPQGLLFYRGFISGYKPILDGNKEYIEITLLSYIFELGYYMLRDGSGNTKIAYNSYDPSDILKDVIDKYVADGGTINYNTTSIVDTGTTVSYTFNTNTVREALDKIIELAPVGWYWYVDSSSIIHFSSRNVVANHTLTIGTHISQMETFRRIEDVVNRVYFTGFTTASGTGLYRLYSNSGSVSTYGLHAISKVDGRVTLTSTADIMANRILDDKATPEIRTVLTLADSNGSNKDRGYDIESIQPGQTMKLRNIKTGVKAHSYWDQMVWEVDVWDATLATTAADVIQILSVDYSPDALKIEASSRLPEISKRIEDIERNRVAELVVNNPVIPVAG